MTRPGWCGLDKGREVSVTDEGIGVILALEGISLLIASNWVKEGRGGISIVGLATVVDQCDIDEQESEKR